MSIALGNIPLNKIYLGSTEIKKVYKGNILMWEGDQFTYYVTNDGNDSNDGLTPQTAWATIAKVNSTTLTAGQSVGFRRGDVWREELVIGESGSIGNPITFGAYGVGALPVITRKDSLSGWDVEANWTRDETVEELNIATRAQRGNLDLGSRNILPSNLLSISGNQVRIRIGPHPTLGTAITGAFIGEQASSGDVYDMEPGTITQITFNGGSNTLSTVTSNTYSDWINYDFDHTKVYIVSIGSTGGYENHGFASGIITATKGGGQAEAGTANVSGYNVSGGEGNCFNMSGIDVSSNAISNNWYKSISYNPVRLWIDGTEAKRPEFVVGMDSLNPWFYDSVNQRLYTYSATNPATTFSNIEIAGTNTQLYSLNGTGRDYVRLKNLDIQGGYGSSIWLDASNDWIIEDCNIGKDAATFGLVGRVSTFPDTCDNVIVRRCTFDSGDRDFYTWYTSANNFHAEDAINIRGGCHNWDIYQNTFVDWRHCAFYIVSIEATRTASGNKFHHNNISCPNIDYGRSVAVDSLPDMAIDNEIYSNIMTDCGVRIQLNANGTKFYYNIIDGVFNDKTPYFVNGVAQGLMFEGYGVTNPKSMEIYNNVFANCDEAGLLIDASNNDAENNLLKNNIFYNCGVSSKNGYNNYQIVITDNVKNLGNTFQNNLLYKDSVTDLVFYGRDATDDYAKTIAEFNAENGTNGDVISNNIGGDPLFVSISDFRLQAASPAINAGVDVGLTEDYDGNPIVGVPDIGAFEYQP